MRPEDLQVNLRPRSSWEAMELGTALLRRHAGAVWRPWLLALLPLFAALNALAWALGQPWLAWLLLWWLKPALERIVLYVLSRAVFGQAPGRWPPCARSGASPGRCWAATCRGGGWVRRARCWCRWTCWRAARARSAPCADGWSPDRCTCRRPC